MTAPRHASMWLTCCALMLASVTPARSQSGGRGTLVVAFVGDQRGHVEVSGRARRGERVVLVLPEGSHLARITQGGCSTSFPVTIVDGATTRVMFGADLHCGDELSSLVATYQQRHERVFVDGRELGLTPIESLPISAGEHSVALRDADGRQLHYWTVTCAPTESCGVEASDYRLPGVGGI